MTQELTEYMPLDLSTDLESGDSLDIYLRELRQSPLLSKEEEISLFHKFHKFDDLESAKKIVVSNLRFVVHIAKTYRGYGLPLLDLIQEGNVGLMKAVKKFNPEKKVRLLSFAIYWIRAEIHEFILKNWKIVKVATTKAQRKLFFKLRSKKNGKTWLTKQETENVANELNVKPETVTLMESRLSGTDISFDPSNNDETAPSDYLSDNKDPSILIENKDTDTHDNAELHNALSKLDDRSKDIIYQRYLTEDKATLADLSKKYKISKERVRQIEEKSLSSLKSSMLLA